MNWALLFGVISTAFKGYTAYRQSRAAAAQARYKAAVDANNQLIAEQNANSIKEAGEVAQQELRRKVRRAKGTAVATAESRGFLVDDPGSSTQLALADLAELGKLDELRIAYNTQLEERRARIQGANFSTQAGLYNLAASQENPLLAGTSTLLAGAASTAKLLT